ncbi:MAG: DUF4145 domain-containing protein [Methanosarcina sp.]
MNKFEPVTVNGIYNMRLQGYEGALPSILSGFGFIEGSSINTIRLQISRCAACGKNIICLDGKIIYPHGSSRQPCPSEVPEALRQDYIEACLVEPDSKKASAALSRRCLQNMLRNNGIQSSNLSKEIDEAMKTLPSSLAESIDAIRQVGNFAAHPLKSTSTGEIVDVEDGEAEWALEVLEDLFDYYYVQPAVIQRKRDAMNQKLASFGKSPLK